VSISLSVLVYDFDSSKVASAFGQRTIPKFASLLALDGVSGLKITLVVMIWFLSNLVVMIWYSFLQTNDFYL
jgi:hypothetical protein